MFYNISPSHIVLSCISPMLQVSLKQPRTKQLEGTAVPARNVPQVLKPG